MSVIFSRSLSVAVSAVLSANAVHGLSLRPNPFCCARKKKNNQSGDKSYIQRLGELVTCCSISPTRRGRIADVTFNYFHGDDNQADGNREFRELTDQFRKNDNLHVFVAKVAVWGIDALSIPKHSEVLLARLTDGGVYEYKAFAFNPGRDVGLVKSAPGVVQFTDNFQPERLNGVMRITAETRGSDDALFLLCGQGNFECGRKVYEQFDVKDAEGLSTGWQPNVPVKYYYLPNMATMDPDIVNCHGYALALMQNANNNPADKDVEKPFEGWCIANYKMPLPKMGQRSPNEGEQAPKEGLIQWREQHKTALKRLIQWREPAIECFGQEQEGGFRDFVRLQDEELFLKVSSLLAAASKNISGLQAASCELTSGQEKDLRTLQMSWEALREELQQKERQLSRMEEADDCSKKVTKLRVEIAELQGQLHGER